MDTDPTTEQMRQETGHDCFVCPLEIRHLTATVHNALNALDAARSDLHHADWQRAWRKVEEMREALNLLKPTIDKHFDDLENWRRP